MDKEKWIEIARTGTFKDSLGRDQTFTREDLSAIAMAYKPEMREAPLVFGHPKSDAAPAFGWVQKLKTEGSKLLALVAHVPEKVKEIVANKHYRHVSMSLMSDRVTLRHVGLLGAAQPAIDGLQAVELSKELNEGGDAVTVDFAATDTTAQGDKAMGEELERELRDQLDAKKTRADQLEKDLGTTRQTAEQVTADFAAYKETVEGEKRTARVDALVQAGKATPAERENILQFAATLASVSGHVDFAASDGTKESISAEERYFRELEARPVDQRFADFSVPPSHVGHGVDRGGADQGYDTAQITAKL